LRAQVEKPVLRELPNG